MQAVILAAGLGTRLRPLTDTIPKPLILVGGIPLIGRTITTLPQAIDELVVVVGYRSDAVRAYVRSVWNKKLFFVEQTELRGTGDAVHQACHVLHDTFLVLNGDDLYLHADLETLIKEKLGILVHELPTPILSGKPICNAEGKLIAIEEQVKTRIVNCGAYMLDERFFDYPLVPLKGKNEFGLPQTLAQIAIDFPVSIVHAQFWMPVGTHEELALANAYTAYPVL